jgi:hypothetical protein
MSGKISRIARMAVSWAIAAPAIAAPGSLFDEAATLDLELEAPLGALMGDRYPDSEYRPAQLRYVGKDGSRVALPVEVRTRGKTRRDEEVCKMPPLRVRFDQAAADGTPFAGQPALKLVTYCRDSDSFDQLVLLEYLAYRTYNLLTPQSHRVRLARISYLERGDRRTTRYGIFLEDWRAVAARNDLTADPVDGGVNVDKLNHDAANRVAVFAYLIGNEDYSLLWPEPDENCCHNIKPLLDRDGRVVPLPYDFDYSGLVNAPYAVAKNPRRKVRQRAYRGLCDTQEGLEAALELTRARREDIYAVFRAQEGLSPAKLKSSMGYLDRFYDLIDQPAQVEKRLRRRCRKS